MSGCSYGENNWKTADELALIVQMEKHGNLRGLQNYLLLADCHRWSPAVNKAEVLLAANEAANRLGAQREQLLRREMLEEQGIVLREQIQ